MPFPKPPLPVLNRGEPLAQGLVNAWPLGENAGNKAYDVAGVSVASLVSTPAWSASPVGSGLTLDGASQYLSLSPVPPILAANNAPVTVAAWLMNTTASSAAANQSVFKLGASAADSPRLFIRFESVATGWLADTATTTLGVADKTVFPFAAGEWFFFTFTDTGALGQFYKNGQPVATTSNTGATQAAGASDESSWGRYRAASTRFWGGNVAGCWLWSRALSAGEVSALYFDTFRMFRRNRVPVPIRPAAAAAFKPGWAYGATSGVISTGAF